MSEDTPLTDKHLKDSEDWVVRETRGCGLHVSAARAIERELRGELRAIRESLVIVEAALAANNTTPAPEFRVLIGADHGKPVLRCAHDQLYTSDDGITDGITMGREWLGELPMETPMNCFWVLRQHGVYIDHDRFRTDLAERNNFQIEA